MRVAKGSTVTITSEPFDAAPDTPTCTVVRADGTEITPAPECTAEDDMVLVPLTAATHLDELDQLTVTITSGNEVQVIEVDVIGSNWVSIASLRKEPKLGDVTAFPDALLREVRDEWESWIEELCNLRMTPGYGVEKHWGRRRRWLSLDANEVTAIRSVTVDDVAVTGAILGPDDRVEYAPGFGATNRVEVHFEHGLTRPPGKLVREVRKAIARELLRRGAQTPNDVISETSTQGGPVIRYSTPDPRAGRWTGIMSLDPIITELRRDDIGVA